MSGRSVPPSWGTVVLAALVTAAVAVAAWGVGAWRTTPKALEVSTASAGTLSVVATPFTDPKDVTVTPTMRSGAGVRSPFAGVVTEFTCIPGQDVSSGDTVARVGARRVVALHTDSPFWRDLTVGSSGEDVAALTKELARLGKLPAGEVSSRLGQRGLAAAMKLAGRDAATLELGDLTWIPARAIRIGSCPAQVGQVVQTGEVLLSQAPSLLDLRVTVDESGVVAGPRVLKMFGQSAPVVDGKVTDPAFVKVVAGSEVLSALSAREGEPVKLPAKLELAEPLTVVSVPAGSITLNGPTACVSVSGTAQSVTVVSSSLGRTLVSFSTVPSTVDLTPPARCAS